MRTLLSTVFGVLFLASSAVAQEQPPDIRSFITVDAPSVVLTHEKLPPATSLTGVTLKYNFLVAGYSAPGRKPPPGGAGGCGRSVKFTAGLKSQVKTLPPRCKEIVGFSSVMP